MSNVKPGDIARIIRDPYAEKFTDGHTNIGKQVAVIGPVTAERNSVTTVSLRQQFGQVWLCKPLQPIWCLDVEKWFTGQTIRYLEIQMRESVIPDQWLRRIDPPADTKDIFGEEPTPGERANVFPSNSGKRLLKEPS